MFHFIVKTVSSLKQELAKLAFQPGLQMDLMIEALRWVDLAQLHKQMSRFCSWSWV